MKQRLGLAGSLLGDPQVLLFDEPVNGLGSGGHLLDPDIHEEPRRPGPDRPGLVAPAVRDGADGRPSDRHRPRQADRRILHRRLHRPIDPDLGARSFAAAGRAADRAGPAPVSPSPTSDGAVEVTGAPIEQIGDVAGRAGVTLHELSAQAGSLEEAFIQLTGDSVEYGTSRAAARPGPRAPRFAPGTSWLRASRCPARLRASRCLARLRASRCPAQVTRLPVLRPATRPPGAPPSYAPPAGPAAAAPPPPPAPEGWDRR